MIKVHQIWIGDVMPEREQAWVAEVRRAAQAAGHEHKLWGWEALEAAFGEEPLAAVFRRAFEFLPGSTVYALASDYYRLRVLAHEPGLYLDTDFELRGDWPEMPEAADVYLMTEFFNRGLVCNGLFYARAREVMLIAYKLAERHLLARLHAEADDFEQELVAMVRGGGLVTQGVGPGWLRRVVLPEWQARGVQVACLPSAVAGHRQWAEQSALTHMGSATWWHDRQDKTGYWDAQALRAEQLREVRERERQVAAAKAAFEAAADKPVWARPQGISILPPVRRREPEKASQPPAVCPLYITDPKRIVIFSNVMQDFEMPELRKGDVCVHLNYARHFEEARQVEGTRHFLLIRGMASSKDGWFHPSSVQGMEHVAFVRDGMTLAGWRWFREWRQVTGKSPSTGFIAANMMRERWPEVPLILAGFDPAHNHGTYRWPGHAWEEEAQWYAERAFDLLPPEPVRRETPPKVLFLLNSCQQPDGSRAAAAKKARNGAARAERRQAQRESWLHDLPPGCKWWFVVGEREGKPTQERDDGLRVLAEEPDVMVAPHGDDLAALSERSAAALRWAVQHEEFDWLVRADDDDYVHVPRLLQMLMTLPQGSMTARGSGGLQKPHWMRGCCQVLSRRLCEAIAADAQYPSIAVYDDVDISEAVMRVGGKCYFPPELAIKVPGSAGYEEVRQDNRLISQFCLSPEAMRLKHAEVSGKNI